MGLDHHVAYDGRHVNPLGVEDEINEVGDVVCQATSIGGRKDVVHEDMVEDLDRSRLVASL